MKRAIKFRGKDLATDKWVYGDLIENQGRFFIYHATSETTVKDDDDNKITIVATEVDNNTVGQFTGLRDNNGKEIYEGDYLEACFKYDDISSDGCVIPDQDCIVHGVVEWDDCSLCIKIQDCEYPLNKEFGNGELGYLSFAAFQSPEDDIEVIGNVHDNPCLLENEKLESYDQD